VSLNVRGLNEKAKRLRIRSLLRDWKADIVALQEINLEYISREVLHSL
jgi:endonuclease/exonuclease/phosphatase family metal-dependent hydrolase